MSRLFGRFVALFSVWTLCGFFALYQATFMTEVAGGALGLVGMTLLLHGLWNGKMKAYAIGLAHFVLAMLMRSGVVFFLPVLVLAEALRFRDRFRNGYASFAVCSLLFLSFFLSPRIQFKLFRTTVGQADTYSQQFYQVMGNSDRWEVIFEGVPILSRPSTWQMPERVTRDRIHCSCRTRC